MQYDDPYNPVSVYVQQCLHSPRGDELIRADRLLRSIHYNEHWALLERIRSYGYDSDSIETLDRIEDMFRRVLENFISEHQIVLEEYDLGTLNNILSGLYRIVDFEDYDSLQQVLDTEGSSEELLSELLVLIVGGEYEDYLRHFSYVHPDLIEQIRDQIERRWDERRELEDLTEQQPFPASLRRVLDYYPTKTMSRLIDEDHTRIGTKLDVFLDEIFSEPRGGTLKEQDYSYAADYVAATLACQEGEEALDSASDWLEKRFRDYQRLQQVIQFITRIRGEVGV